MLSLAASAPRWRSGESRPGSGPRASRARLSSPARIGRSGRTDRRCARSEWSRRAAVSGGGCGCNYASCSLALEGSDAVAAIKDAIRSMASARRSRSALSRLGAEGVGPALRRPAAGGLEAAGRRLALAHGSGCLGGSGSAVRRPLVRVGTARRRGHAGVAIHGRKIWRSRSSRGRCGGGRRARRAALPAVTDGRLRRHARCRTARRIGCRGRARPHSRRRRRPAAAGGRRRSRTPRPAPDAGHRPDRPARPAVPRSQRSEGREPWQRS